MGALKGDPGCYELHRSAGQNSLERQADSMEEVKSQLRLEARDGEEHHRQKKTVHQGLGVDRPRCPGKTASSPV